MFKHSLHNAIDLCLLISGRYEQRSLLRSSGREQVLCEALGGESDHRVHFGLGAATQADQIQVRWLSGKVQTLTNVAANQSLTVKEPSQ